ncbi:MAG: hypothetical protein CFE21_02925 [Bacteroidetes bacterium B1(2017)]|nr:MAG: hypothetical protein CFE21_02925 [Bacteroidetes bacterium B1(2017)]
MKNVWGFLAMFILASFLIGKSVSTFEKEEWEGMEEDIALRIQLMQKMLADPSTGQIPDDIRQQELAFAYTLPSDLGMQKFANWRSVGPFNVGGRTRAVAIDVTNSDVLLAGAATGGVWRSTNGGGAWYATNMSSMATANITSLVQDTRTNKTKVWYASTGELYGGSIPGAFYNGSGVYKSVDGGDTWVKTGNFNSGQGGLSTAWSVVHRIALNPTIDTADVIFAANFDGIFRSINAGLSWIKVRGGGSRVSAYSYFTDVAVTPTGIVYATLSGGGQQQGIWRSADNGKNWANITPANFQSTVNRISIGIAPSDEKQVYFIANTPGQGKESKNFEGKSEYNSLWKYTYVSGDGTGTGGTWDDRSANIPAGAGGFSDYISQGSYCLEVDVKPDDANTVFIGGTNLYRSTDGFSTSTHITQIGGYGINTSLPDFKVYPNHHPDNHGAIFYPNNPSKMISFHDGGISITTNCLATPLVWESLNNGYNTSQYYSIAQDPIGTSKTTIGGLQDNGTYLSMAPTAISNWSQPLSYDGSFGFLKPGGGEVYLSIQQGRMHRMILDASGTPTQFTRIDPKGVDKEKYQFINPFTPDATNFKVLYTPAGNVLWRNSDITAIPLKSKLDSNASSVNWTQLSHTTLPAAGDEITALLSSKIQSDVLYYATSAGRIYRLRNARDTASIPETITGSNFPGGYINCIAQHPKDTGTIYVVFTNYAILSIFESKNSGASWTAISGNLEQNASGSGTGPSCRWLTIAPTLDSLIYFVGTSTGLYATKKIEGMQTTWIRQGASSIGTQVVTMMDHRTSDGRMVVSTYGSGVFESYVQSLDPKTGLKQIGNSSLQIFPNPSSDFIKIKGIQDNGLLQYQILDQLGQQVQGGFANLSEEINISNLPSGIYYFILTSSSASNISNFIKK